jgi:hypothetical protein
LRGSLSAYALVLLSSNAVMRMVDFIALFLLVTLALALPIERSGA